MVFLRRLVVAVCFSFENLLNGLIALVEHVIRFSFKKSLQPVTNAKYTSTYLRVFAKTAFANLHFKDLPRHVLIPSFLIDS